ncbi:N-6 DNA methylase [uncultured Tyzzerella sp.]|uniref:N-6 DNA methylase n=1 Tax=uncultured Tyzzerella sp. TaxID=2321398 RepID=UPI00294252F4|nr:N-6 DNA methylase [uncultured Tyzzerella sp.]
MPKKKVFMKKSTLDKTLNDFYSAHYSKKIFDKNLEEDVDDIVKDLLKPIFGTCVTGKKTGNKKIDHNIPTYHGETGSGKPDIMIYNYFGNEEVSLIIENKNFTSKENAITQAECYAKVGDVIKKPVRVIIGNSPSHKLEVKVLTEKGYLPLSINGKIVNQFIGKDILELIYNNPNVNEFVLEELIEKKFTQKDFHNIINKLKTLYRQIPEIQNNDDLSINFTVSFIALKMIMEKQKISWESINNPDDIKKEIDNIIGKKASQSLKEKYEDIFVMIDKDDNLKFNFRNIVDAIDIRENGEDISPEKSVLMDIHNNLTAIPQKDLSIDLFGEVYECLASKKTKSVLGEYFTRRHIIQAIVRMFFSEDDIQNIVEYKKTIGDPACGTGGFLTESFKYIKEYCEKEHPGLDLTGLASEIMIGYDINANSIGRTRVNMTLAGDGFSDIQRFNTLTTPFLDKDNNNGLKKDIDYILTNVPYGKGDIALNDPNSSDEFLKSNNNKRLELNFVIKIIYMLKKGGRASIIVPEGLLEAPTLAPFREYLLKQCKLTTIISLPKFAFAPYTKWKTYVIFIEKRNQPLNNIDQLIAKNERTWCYIVDNDGYANSDKRFPTALKDSNGKWLHDELQPYIDYDGVMQSSKIEQAYECKLEDEKQSYFNEWNEEIKGKKCGFITIHDITEKKTEQYQLLTAKEVINKIKLEANNQTALNDEDYSVLTDSLKLGKKGYSVKKEDYLEDGQLKEEMIPIFETLQIDYDAENNKYYDLSQETTTFLLPLIPEKYLRKKEITTITLDELTTKVNEIENELKHLFGGVHNA